MGHLTNLTVKALGEAEKKLSTTVLSHKRQTFCFLHLGTVKMLIEKEIVPVVINKPFLKLIAAEAAYVWHDAGAFSFATQNWFGLFSIPMPKVNPGNTLYLRAFPSSLNVHTVAVLAHEAVHIHSDLVKHKKKALTDEEMGWFVYSFLLARLAPAIAKKFARDDNELLLGCIASDFLDANSGTAVISSKQFDKRVSFDFTKEGGVKGTANPYQAFTKSATIKAYKKDFKDAQLFDPDFDGDWDFDGIPKARAK